MHHLYDDDGAISMGTKLWFLDVVDGRVGLLPDQRDDFHFLLEERAHDRFYASATEAYIFDFQRVQSRFAMMVEELADDGE
jgi:hypothetical protein